MSIVYQNEYVLLNELITIAPDPFGLPSFISDSHSLLDATNWGCPQSTLASDYSMVPSSFLSGLGVFGCSDWYFGLPDLYQI